jgi:hypothetical protein
MDTHDRQSNRPVCVHLNRVRRSGRALIVAAVLAVVALLVPQWVGGLASGEPAPGGRAPAHDRARPR